MVSRIQEEVVQQDIRECRVAPRGAHSNAFALLGGARSPKAAHRLLLVGKGRRCVMTSIIRIGIRRLMRNCEERRRSQDRMLMHQTLSKGWCHAGSRLLPGLIVRPRRRLVEAQALFGVAESWPSSLAYRPRGHHPGDPRPVAPLQKRARFLALCSRTSAPLLPEPLFPKPTQPEGALSGARFARLPACSGPNALWCFGGLPCPGHYSHSCHCEGESFSQGTVCRAGHLREERLQDRVGLRVQGSTFGQPRGRDLRLRAGGGSLRRPPHRRLSHHRGLSRDLPGRQGLYGCGVGTTLD